MINRGEREEFVKLFFLKDYWEERLMSPFAHFVLYIPCQWRSADFPGDPTLNTDVSETLWWMESVLWAFLCSIWKLSAPRAAREGLKQGQGRGWGVYSEKGEIRGEITGLWVSDEAGFICYIYMFLYNRWGEHEVKHCQVGCSSDCHRNIHDRTFYICFGCLSHWAAA